MLLLFGLAAVVVLISKPWRPIVNDELAYNGQSLSWWIGQLDSDRAQEAQLALRTLGPKAAPMVLAMLRHGELMEVEAISALRALGPDSVPVLIGFVSDSSEEVRMSVLTAIGALRAQTGPYADRVLAALIPLLSDPDPEIRFLTLNDLGRFGPRGRSAVPAVTEALSDRDIGSDGESIMIRARAAHVLGRIGPDSEMAVPHLIRLLRDGDAFTRGQAGIALWRIRHDTSLMLPILSNMLEDPDPSTRYAAVLALLRIGMETQLSPELSARVDAVKPAYLERRMAQVHRIE